MAFLAVRSQDDEASPRGFNWGAFFLSWIWSIFNRSLNIPTIVLLVLCLTPYIGFAFALVLAIYSGVTGHKRAWRNGKWRDMEHFVSVQRRWAVLGLLQFIAAILLFIFLPVFYEK
jgi:hypothetical protein